MNKSFGLPLAVCSLFFLTGNGKSAPPSIGAIVTSHVFSPVETPFGIVFTNETRTALYLAHFVGPARGETRAEKLFSAPGCGMYSTLSPDRSTIGFKEIFGDGTQAPALLNISTKKVNLLHPPVPQSGQVSFAANGAIAYSVGSVVFVRNGTAVRQIPIGTYSNIVEISSDGNSIAYTDGRGRVFVMNIQSQKVRRVSDAGCMTPLWSPVGARLCYSSLNGRLYVFDAQDEKTYFLGDGTDPVWTPDGVSLIVVRERTQNDTLVSSNLYQISYDGEENVRLTSTRGIFETEPSIGADNIVHYTAYNNDTLYSATLEKNSLRINSSIEIGSESLVQNETVLKSLQETESVSPGGTPSATPFFEVPYVNQVWDTPYGFGNLGSSACGPTSAIMVIAYYNLLPPWNNQLAVPTRHVNAWGNYVLEPYHFHGVYFQSGSSGAGGGYGYMWNTSDPYHMMVSYYGYHGLTASELDAPSLDTVTSEVSTGHPYTLCNGLTEAGHIVVINGVGNQKGTVIVNDPYGNKNVAYPSPNGKDVQYDWPGYNNGNQNLNNAWWGVSVRYVAPAISDSIVDDLQFESGFTLNNSKPASMSLWLDRTSGYGGHFWYTYTRHSDTCTASWSQPALLQTGSYEVFAYIASGTARAARYRIFYAGNSATVVVDQSQYKDSWVSLGTYPFASGDSGYVKLGDGSDSVGQIIEFDALAWRIQSSQPSIPTQMTLEQNYPNPFNPSTVISYQLSAVSRVTLKIYDVLGREVATLVNQEQNPGSHVVTFNAGKLASGVYFYRLDTGTFKVTKKMVLVK